MPRIAGVELQADTPRKRVWAGLAGIAVVLVVVWIGISSITDPAKRAQAEGTFARWALWIGGALVAGALLFSEGLLAAAGALGIALTAGELAPYVSTGLEALTHGSGAPGGPDGAPTPVQEWGGTFCGLHGGVQGYSQVTALDTSLWGVTCHDGTTAIYPGG